MFHNKQSEPEKNTGLISRNGNVFCLFLFLRFVVDVVKCSSCFVVDAVKCSSCFVVDVGKCLCVLLLMQ